jgi:hypothetical protein
MSLGVNRNSPLEELGDGRRVGGEESLLALGHSFSKLRVMQEVSDSTLKSIHSQTHPVDEHELGELRSGVLDASERPHDFAVRKFILELVESTGACTEKDQQLLSLREVRDSPEETSFNSLPPPTVTRV